MPDMHVVSLRYILQPDERFSYDNPQPEEFETPEARFRLADDVLTCEMKIHFSGAAAARELIDPILRDWEAWVDLRHNRGLKTRSAIQQLAPTSNNWTPVAQVPQCRSSGIHERNCKQKATLTKMGKRVIWRQGGSVSNVHGGGADIVIADTNFGYRGRSS